MKTKPKSEPLLTGVSIRTKLPTKLRTRTPHRRPERADLEYYIAISSVSGAAYHFCGSTSAYKIIRRWCKEYDIPIPPVQKRIEKKLNRPFRTDFLKILHKYETMREIAKHYGANTSTIRRWIKFYGVRR